MPHTQHALRLASRLRLLAAATLVALLAACATAPEGAGPASADRAERLLRGGNAAAAAEMYETLATRNPPPVRNDFALSAARAWLAANRADDAQRAVELASTSLSATQQFERELVRAEVAVARGQYAPAWQQLSKVPEPASATEAGRLFQLQQQVALRAGQPLEAVRAGVARERVAASDAERTRARRDLLTDLRGAIDRGLRIEPAESRDALVRGWLEVAQIAAAAGRSPMGADAAVARWRARYPGHPASTIVASDILAPAERARPANAAASASDAAVALLLPVTGPLASTAGLIRDGFLAAVSRMPEAQRPAVRVYDTGKLPVGTALQNARADGASFIVGPLTREEVQAAFEQRPAGVPLLLLNALAGGSVAGAQVYQYPLAPEDEARQIARQITGAGQRNVAVLAPSGDWGNRVAGAFIDELGLTGGHVAAQSTYDLSRGDLITAVTAVLGIDEANARHRRVQQLAGTSVQFIAQPRQDIDAIFVAGWQSLALRQINPLLRQFNAAEIPTYTTQDGLDADVQANRDLEGMRLLDMPWMLDGVGAVADLRTATESAWASYGQRPARFFAFGYDAATLMTALRRGTNSWPLPGLTGRLSLTPDGRVERGLNWARLREGQVQPFDPQR